jgi:2-polyprenyl-3-methyl-5-hydroxy-6-metoxy-1,4-benzoquinol methylase
MVTAFRQCSNVQEAATILADVVREQDGGDANYFKSQLSRYLYSVKRITALRPPPARVLDIGSHYLQQTALLSLMGYDVVGIDVPLFTEAPFVRERAARLRITNIGTEGHQAGAFLQGDGYDGTFDVIVCTEILEHIAFNPVAFWRRVWQLLSPNGIIYLTTPNSFRVRALVKALLRLVRLEGLGLSVEEVLTVVTYGHHWKEYSSAEIKKYFALLSPDFTVETHTYEDADSNHSLVSKALEILPPFRSNIEAIIRLRSRTKFLDSPVLPMMAKAGSHV